MSDLVWTPVKIKLGQIQPWTDNPRMSTKAQAQRLIKSERRLGQIQTLAIGPMIDGKYPLYDGHQRVSSWLTVKTPDFEVMALQSNRQLTEDERKQVAVLLHTATGGWDWNALSGWSAADLREWGMDKDTLKGWQSDAKELTELLNSEQAESADAEPQISRADELLEKWKVQTGDLWQIGEHRLLCGDSTKREDVERVMGGERAELLFTSPPYADMREYGGNDLSLETLVEMFPLWRSFTKYFSVNLGIQFKNGEVYQYWNEWIEGARACGLKFLSWNVWDRINATSVSAQKKMFAVTHEWIFVFGDYEKELNRTWEKSEESQKREKYYRVNNSGQKVTTRRQADGSVKESVIGMVYDNKNMGTVFTGFAEMERSIDHPAKFPADLPAGYIGAMTNIGDFICEPFAGSGTTIVACQNLGRKCRAVEISPAYCSVILERMSTAFPELEIKRL